MDTPNPKESPWVANTSQDTFQQDVVDRSRQLPVVVDFWAAWCQPCRMLGPILEKLAGEYNGKFLLVKADTEAMPEAAAQFGVQSIPAVFGVRDGKVVDFFVGVLPEQHIRVWLDGLLPSEAEVLSAEARELAATDPAGAEAKYREAMEDAHAATPRIGLAQLLLDQDRLDECAEIVQQLEERGFLEPEAEKVKSALTLRQKGEVIGDLEACRAAAAEDPEDLQLQLRLAEALAVAKNYEEALELGLKTVQADRHGMGEKARKMMVDIFRLLPDDSELTSTYRRKLSTALY